MANQNSSSSVIALNGNGAAPTAAYYDLASVRIAGGRKSYARAGGEGRTVMNQLCPECGSTVYWEADLRSEEIGIAVGAFADSDFPPPSFSVFHSRKHKWIEFSGGIPTID